MFYRLLALLVVISAVVCQENDEGDGTRLCTVLNHQKGIAEAVKNLGLPEECDDGGELQVVCCPEIEDNSPSNETMEAEPDFEPADIDPSMAERISLRKCREYSRNAIYGEFSTITSNTMVDVCALRADSYTSGKTELELKFMSQPKDALAKELPHMAAIGFVDASGNINWQCEGALISENYVLTAGHCLNHSTYGEPKVVRLGDLDLAKKYKSERYAQTFEVLETLVFPTYYSTLHYDDIGLIKLKGKVEFSAFIRPACLASETHNLAGRVIASGYKRSNDLDRLPSKLQRVLLEKFSYEECSSAYGPNDPLPRGIEAEYQFCVGPRKTTSDFCQNDSGAPLQIFHPSQYCMYSVVGIASFGDNCGKVDFPSVYIRVSSYLNWIESAIWG